MRVKYIIFVHNFKQTYHYVFVFTYCFNLNCRSGRLGR